MFGKAVMLALALSLSAFAQGRGGGGRGSGMGEMGSGEYTPRVQPKTKLQLFAEKLKLSSEQIDQVNTIFVATSQEMTPVRAQVDKSRSELAEAILEGKSQEDLNKMLEAHAGLEAQMDAMEAQAFAKVLALLKPNQQAKASQAFELMAGAFDRAPNQGGGRGGSGRRGGR